MVTKKRWTDEENNILVQAITANPNNIKETCRYASKQLKNRSEKACSLHWYKVLSPKNDTTKTGITFMTISSKAICNNRKNGNSISLQTKKSTIIDKIKKLLKLK